MTLGGVIRHPLPLRHLRYDLFFAGRNQFDKARRAMIQRTLNRRGDVVWRVDRQNAQAKSCGDLLVIQRLGEIHGKIASGMM